MYFDFSDPEVLKAFVSYICFPVGIIVIMWLFGMLVARAADPDGKGKNKDEKKEREERDEQDTTPVA